METVLKNLSKEELLELVSTQTLQISSLSDERESLSRESSVKDEKIEYLESCKSSAKSGHVILKS